MANVPNNFFTKKWHSCPNSIGTKIAGIRGNLRLLRGSVSILFKNEISFYHK